MSQSSFAAKDAIGQNTRDALKAIAPRVVDELGEGWSLASISEDCQNATWRGPDGAELNVWEGWPHDGKVSISVNFKDRDKDGHQFWYLPYKTSRPSISINPARGSKAVANDIKRRLLPVYLPLLAECNEARAKFEARQTSDEDTATVLALSIGGQARKNHDGYSFGVNAYASEKLAGQSFDLKVHNDEVTFDRLRVSPFVAKEILRLLVQRHVVKDGEE